MAPVSSPSQPSDHTTYTPTLPTQYQSLSQYAAGLATPTPNSAQAQPSHIATSAAATVINQSRPPNLNPNPNPNLNANAHQQPPQPQPRPHPHPHPYPHPLPHPSAALASSSSVSLHVRSAPPSSASKANKAPADSNPDTNDKERRLRGFRRILFVLMGIIQACCKCFFRRGEAANDTAGYQQVASSTQMVDLSQAHNDDWQDMDDPDFDNWDDNGSKVGSVAGSVAGDDVAPPLSPTIDGSVAVDIREPHNDVGDSPLASSRTSSPKVATSTTTSASTSTPSASSAHTAIHIGPIPPRTSSQPTQPEAIKPGPPKHIPVQPAAQPSPPPEPEPEIDFFGDLGLSVASTSIQTNIVARAIPMPASSPPASITIDPSHTSHFDLDTLMGDDSQSVDVGTAAWGDDLDLDLGGGTSTAEESGGGNKKKGTGGKGKMKKPKLAVQAVAADDDI